METNISLSNPLEFRHHLQPLLSPREELLWTGKPKQGIIFRPYDIVVIPFSLLWGGGVTNILSGMIASVLAEGAIFILFLLPLLLIFGGSAFYLTVGRFLIDIYNRSTTTYGITNRRIIIQKKGIGGKITSYDLKSLDNLKIEQGKNGRGTVIVGVAPYLSPMRLRGFEWHGRSSSEPPALEQILNAQQVYQLIQDIRD